MATITVPITAFILWFRVDLNYLEIAPAQTMSDNGLSKSCKAAADEIWFLNPIQSIVVGTPRSLHSMLNNSYGKPRRRVKARPQHHLRPNERDKFEQE